MMIFCSVWLEYEYFNLTFSLRNFAFFCFLENGTAMWPASSLSRCENSNLQLLRRNRRETTMKQMKTLKTETLKLKMKCRVLAF